MQQGLGNALDKSYKIKVASCTFDHKRSPSPRNSLKLLPTACSHDFITCTTQSLALSCDTFPPIQQPLWNRSGTNSDCSHRFTPPKSTALSCSVNIPTSMPTAGTLAVMSPSTECRVIGGGGGHLTLKIVDITYPGR